MHNIRHTKLFLLIAIALALAVCSRQTEQTTARHYALTGRVVALNTHDRSATIDAAAIPGFMEAMTMEYPVKSKADFDKLRIGDRITATVDVLDSGLYDLSNVQRQGSGTAK